MTTSGSAPDVTRGRCRGHRSRLRAALAVAVGVLLTGSAAYAVALPQPSERRVGNALVQDLAARNAGQQVLGGAREPGRPSIQRLRHDDVVFTVTVVPARPGPNLVRVDASYDDARPHRRHHGRVFVGTADDDRAGTMTLARPRPGADGLWAVIDLPEGTGSVLVTHGRRHRVPFAVDTGTAVPQDVSAWVGPDGPACAAAATASLLAGGPASTSCPSSALSEPDRSAIESVVDTLTTRGVEEIAVRADGSARSEAASGVVRRAAGEAGVRVVPESAPPGPRNALLVLSGWQDAASALARVSALPLQRQAIRSDGTWLAPWLLSPGVVDSTSGVVVPLDFDIRDDGAREFGQALATYLPGQAPTSTAYAAWRAARGVDPAPVGLFAASRAAYLPADPGHVGHETEVAWFPGGTVTPIGPPTS
jgi:hypothetical protein